MQFGATGLKCPIDRVVAEEMRDRFEVDFTWRLDMAVGA